MRSARGDVVVQMDADTLLDSEALASLLRYFAFGQRTCVVGQVVGYGNNHDGDVTRTEESPFEEYVGELARMRKAEDWPADMRFQTAHHVPWMFAWTGLIALRRADVVSEDLYFDESFRGWGVDDLEWGYRVCRSRLPIELRPDVFALHLPHVRNVAANERTEAANYERFLRKWPHRDVELARFVGDVEANRIWPEYQAMLCEVGGEAGFGVVVEDRAEGLCLWIGAPKARRDLTRRSQAYLDLTGMFLPFDDDSAVSCIVDPRVENLPADYRDAIVREARRVSRAVEAPRPDARLTPV
jgi:hypothetical protein